MTRVEAYHILGDLWYEATSKEKEAISMAQDALQFVDLVPGHYAPVVCGKWVGLEYDGYADGCPVYDVWECSECGEEVSGEDVPETHPYCHGCGARMDGE